MALGRKGWIVPYFNGEKRLKKPILIYWALALAGQAGQGVGLTMDFAFRLLPYLGGWLAVLSLFGLGRRLFSPRAGVISALFLISVYYFHMTVREIIIDPLLTGLLTFCWYAFSVILQRLGQDPSRTPAVPAVLFYLALGLACLAKGPFLLGAFAILPMSLFLLWDRRALIPAAGGFHWVRRSGLFWGAPLALAVGFSWFLLLLWTGEGESVWMQISQENIQRAMGRVDHNSGLRVYPFIFYFYNIPQHFLPWSLLFVPLLGWGIGVWRRRGPIPRPGGLSLWAKADLWDSQAKLLFCAIAVPFFLMGTVGSKRSLYLFPIYPFLALALGAACERMERTGGEGRPWNILWGLLVALIAVLSPLVPMLPFLPLPASWEAPSPPPGLTSGPWAFWAAWALAILLAGPAWMACRAVWRGRVLAGTAWAIGSVCCLGFLFEALVRPALIGKEDKVVFYAKLKEVVGDRPLVQHGWSSNEAVWYLDREVHDVDLPSLKDAFFGQAGSYLLTRDREYVRSEALRAATQSVLTVEMDGKVFRLLRPDPDHPPSPELFAERPGGRRKDRKEREE
jgi:4-amino-4-deoxy-L-arabinose transferase-like glycosyltransferase